MGWLWAAVVVRKLLLKLFILCQVESDVDHIWCEWYEGKGLLGYRTEFEYLHKLC